MPQFSRNPDFKSSLMHVRNDDESKIPMKRSVLGQPGLHFETIQNKLEKDGKLVTKSDLTSPGIKKSLTFAGSFKRGASRDVSPLLFREMSFNHSKKSKFFQRPSLKAVLFSSQPKEEEKT